MCGGGLCGTQTVQRLMEHLSLHMYWEGWLKSWHLSWYQIIQRIAQKTNTFLHFPLKNFLYLWICTCLTVLLMYSWLINQLIIISSVVCLCVWKGTAWTSSWTSSPSSGSWWSSLPWTIRYCWASRSWLCSVLIVCEVLWQNCGSFGRFVCFRRRRRRRSRRCWTMCSVLYQFLSSVID